jgi:hypothetical protein
MDNKCEITKYDKLEIPSDAPRDKEGNINPFHYDAYHMGEDFSRTVMLMFPNHKPEKTEYLILVNKKTGERAWIEFPKSWQ